ncbi:Phosphatidylinositol 4-phosphate 5-kinase 1 [Zea mays]|uniref:1-phosphatidylinositol-4-phosphate 5-kinase n=1 Tax=Zea mays TaxID=4577 RepID=A0A3L6EWJ6_MAIZE|nr:Phosphatidylinositol 4-phosphate 5-kinase 1 [Zea mays]
MGPRPRVCLFDYESVRQVLFNKFGHFFKDDAHPTILAMLDKGLVLVEGTDWVRHRRVVNPAFAMDKLKMLMTFSNATKYLKRLALSKTLPKLPDLVELYLSDLNLENKGTIAIAKALEQSAPQLEILLKMLPKYYNHVRAYDNTLITKKFGVHRITLKGGRKVRFVVMGNMFCTEL